jgi:hypothetical protein
MLLKSRVLENLLHLSSTSRSRSAITLAAVSFAICHFVAMATMPAPAVVTVDPDAEIPRQLIHFAAVFCRFALPLGVMVVGMIHARAKQSTQP